MNLHRVINRYFYECPYNYINITYISTKRKENMKSYHDSKQKKKFFFLRPQWKYFDKIELKLNKN